MNPRLYSSLFKVIEDFIEEECESDEWQYDSFFAPENMAELMTNAASNIYDAIKESSRFTSDSIG